MRMMDELKPLYLYSSNKKVYAPIDEKDKRHGAAILMLTPNMETSSRLMNLPYIYNPSLFTSFYIDRNVMAYIDKVGEENIEFDEQEEEAVSEAMMTSWVKKCKVKFLDGTSFMDKRYIESVFNSRNISKQAHALNIPRVPEELHIIVHANMADLQKDAPSSLVDFHKEHLTSYSKDNEVHLISKLSYDENRMCGPYEMYLTSELIYTLMMCQNDNLHYLPCKAAGVALSGLIEWMDDNDSNQIKLPEKIEQLAKVINVMKKKKDLINITKYIRTADVGVFKSYMARTAISDLRTLIFESELSYFERQRLLPSDFGIPDKRKYPMPDEEHMRAAIRMFNNCDPDDEEELAEDILKRIKRFGITDIKVGVGNRFYKYWKKENKDKDDKDPKKNESALLEGSFEDSDYTDILKICDHLSKDELNKITFYDTYRNSKFVIKRFIHRVGFEPAGFLDVYQFPSQPKIAQIVIAVDGRYRDKGVAKALVKEMLNSDLHNKFGFDIYYWTAHKDNIASQNLATKFGFNHYGITDKYDRLVYTLPMNDNSDNIFNYIDDDLKPSRDEAFTESTNTLISHDLALFTEADDERAYSQKLRKYLYAERIKNNRAVLNLYDKIKETNPWIKRTYPRLKMYKKFNVFIDLSYYNSLFLSKNTYKLDKAVNFYFEFMCRLLNNKDINDEYKKKTVFIPIDTGVWPMVPMSDLYDYKKNLNPISVIFRLVRTNPALLKKEFGNKDIIFVGSRGYFKVDFKNFDIRNLNRFKINLRKLMSVDEPIKDDFEADDINNDDINDEKSSPKAIATSVIGKIEKGTGVTINNISGINTTNVDINTADRIIPSHEHLKISSEKLAFDKKLIDEDNGVAIITIDPDGPDGFQRMQGSLLSMASKIKTYCIPK